MSPTSTVLPLDTPSRPYPLAWNPKHTPRCSIEAPIPLSDSNSERLSPARTIHGRGKLVSSESKLRSPCVDFPQPVPGTTLPLVTIATPVRTPKALVRRNWTLWVCLQLWGPGLKLTSGRRTRLPPHAQPSGNCSLNACVAE